MADTTSSIKGAELFIEEQPSPMLVKHPDGVVEEMWYLDSLLHRMDGPAVIRYNPDGKIVSNTWYVRGELHRDDGPAYLSSTVEEWYQHNKRHRTHGPARIDKQYGGKVVSRTWFTDGRMMARENGSDLAI